MKFVIAFLLLTSFVFLPTVNGAIIQDGDIVNLTFSGISAATPETILYTVPVGKVFVLSSGCTRGGEISVEGDMNVPRFVVQCNSFTPGILFVAGEDVSIKFAKGLRVSGTLAGCLRDVTP